MPAVRVNLCPNPALKTDTTGWTLNTGPRSTGLTGMSRTTGIALGGTDYAVSPEVSGVVAGLTYTKVVRVSDELSAEKLVRRRA